jgi:DNA-binding transcriptional regulator YiaG
MKPSDFGVYYTDYPNYIHHIRIRILAKCVKNANGCLEYRSGKLKHKYGLTSITLKGIRRSVPVHRAIWMATHNCLELPGNVVIRHKCDNPCCCNIDHLEDGTCKDNAQDKIKRGRYAKKIKLHTRQCKLSDETVKAIRNESEGYKQWHIAEKYGVSVGYVSKLRSGKAKTLV